MMLVYATVRYAVVDTVKMEIPDGLSSNERLQAVIDCIEHGLWEDCDNVDHNVEDVEVLSIMDDLEMGVE